MIEQESDQRWDHNLIRVDYPDDQDEAARWAWHRKRGRNKRTGEPWDRVVINRGFKSPDVLKADGVLTVQVSEFAEFAALVQSIAKNLGVEPKELLRDE